LLTQRAAFEIRNTGPVRADCRIEGAPAWLTLGLLDAPALTDPSDFRCEPGQTEVVECIGRVDKLPAQGTRHTADLQIQIAGGPSYRVEITVRTRSGQARSSRLGSAVMIGCATVLLLAAVAWFLIQVLPLLQ
jgi:hypothetical protein